MKKIKQEKETIEAMISIFCKGIHKEDSICEECGELLDYSSKRLDSCKFGDEKPRCSKCEIHCYKPEMRERIKKVMRYAGPRMLTKLPVMAVKHLMHGKRPKTKKES